jgi:hypothetical protein
MDTAVLSARGGGHRFAQKYDFKGPTDSCGKACPKDRLEREQPQATAERYLFQLGTILWLRLRHKRRVPT